LSHLSLGMPLQMRRYKIDRPRVRLDVKQRRWCALTAAYLTVMTGCGSGTQKQSATTAVSEPTAQPATYFVTKAVRGSRNSAGELPETLVLLTARDDSVSLISRCTPIEISVKFTEGTAKTGTAKTGTAKTTSAKTSAVEANPCVAGLPTASIVLDVLRSSPTATRNDGEVHLASSAGDVVAIREAEDQSVAFDGLTGTWVLDSLIDSSGEPVDLTVVMRRPTLTFGPRGLLRSAGDLGVDGQLACNTLYAEQVRIAADRLWLFGSRMTAAACPDARDTIDVAFSALLLERSVEFVAQGNSLVLGGTAARLSRVVP
jgi:META domain